MHQVCPVATERYTGMALHTLILVSMRWQQCCKKVYSESLDVRYVLSNVPIPWECGAAAKVINIQVFCNVRGNGNLSHCGACALCLICKDLHIWWRFMQSKHANTSQVLPCCAMKLQLFRGAKQSRACMVQLLC
jgi:hypothetical protein